MLSQLQEGVDLEMNKKTNELALQNSKIKELEETMTKLVETNAKQVRCFSFWVRRVDVIFDKACLPALSVRPWFVCLWSVGHS